MTIFARHAFLLPKLQRLVKARADQGRALSTRNHIHAHHLALVALQHRQHSPISRRPYLDSPIERARRCKLAILALYVMSETYLRNEARMRRNGGHCALAPQIPDLEGKECMRLYDTMINKTRDLMMNKNHDYGEAWREMRVSSLTDLILQKLLRVKQIEDNQGNTLVSEGIDANYTDIINYAIFALIHLKI